LPSIDLNADLGEGFGVWRMGDDAAMLRVVTSANIACGFHAGDPDIMARCLIEAKRSASPSGRMFRFPISPALGGERCQCRPPRSSGRSPISSARDRGGALCRS